MRGVKAMSSPTNMREHVAEIVRQLMYAAVPQENGYTFTAAPTVYTTPGTRPTRISPVA
ncbi:hypothetical protein ACU4GD_43470 [Cupriavidus basilensis]